MASHKRCARGIQKTNRGRLAAPPTMSIVSKGFYFTMVFPFIYLITNFLPFWMYMPGFDILATRTPLMV